MGSRIRPVDVISICSANGDIRPLRLRVEDDNQEFFRVDIDEIVSVKDIRHVGNEARVFLCRGTFAKQCRLFELKYMIRTHMWCLLRTIN